MPSERWRRTSSSRAESGHGSLIRDGLLARQRQLVEEVAQGVGAEAAALGAGAQPLRRDRLALGVVGDHVGGGDQRGEAVGVLGVVALDRDGDPLRQVPAPGEDAADQRVVDAELLAFVAQPLLGGAGDRVEVDLVARVQAGDDEATDVVQQRRDRELVAFDPADDAADLVGGALGGEGVDAEALGLQLPAAVGLEEVEARRGAGDRQHARGLEHVDRVGDAGDAAGDQAAAVGEAKHRDRQGDVGLDRFDQFADAGGLSGRGARSPARATRSGPGSARPPRRPRPGALPGAARAASAGRLRRTPSGLPTLPFARLVGRLRPIGTTHRQRETFGLAETYLAQPITASSISPSGECDRKALDGRRRSCPRSCSRPSAASDSKIPGETELPVIATRIGW